MQNKKNITKQKVVVMHKHKVKENNDDIVLRRYKTILLNNKEKQK